MAQVQVTKPGVARPGHRSPVVDTARAGALVVVVMWHWGLSVTSRTPDGTLVMPNPIDAVPGSWLATWALQVVPVFFLVGGYVHAASWQRRRVAGQGWPVVLRARLRRLVYPVAAWAGAWSVLELVAELLPGTRRPVWAEFPGLVTPLWFLAVYLPLVALTPVAVRLQRRHGERLLGALGAGLVLGSVAERGAGLTAAAWPTAVLVWLCVFQLGIAWRVHQLDRWPARARAAIAGAGLAGVVVLTGPAGYPRSLVATTDGESNLFPTTAAVASLAVLQLGLLLLSGPSITRLLRRPALRRVVTALTDVTLTVYLWHMSAYYLVLAFYEASGWALIAEPGPGWWQQRWLWLLGPGLVLAAALPLLRRVEEVTRRPQSGSMCRAADGGG